MYVCMYVCIYTHTVSSYGGMRHVLDYVSRPFCARRYGKGYTWRIARYMGMDAVRKLGNRKGKRVLTITHIPIFGLVASYHLKFWLQS